MKIFYYAEAREYSLTEDFFLENYHDFYSHFCSEK